MPGLDAHLQGLRHPRDRPRPAQRRTWPARSAPPSPSSPRRDQILVARDMRPSGVELSRRLRRRRHRRRRRRRRPRACLHRRDVLRLRARSTRPGAMFTASHNPAQYNGIKLCLAGARPVGEDTGLAEIKAAVAAGDRRRRPPSAGARSRLATCSRTTPPTSARSSTGSVLRPLKVVADTANGMGGLVVPRVFDTLPFDLEILFGELDGTFPNHPADPIQPENLRDLQARVRRHRRRRRPGLRRRRRPRASWSTTRPSRLGLDDHRHGRRGHARQASRRDDPVQPDLLEGGARGHPGARRHPGPHPGRPLLHQGGDGRDRRRLRRRALGPLLLPRQLPGRLRLDRRPGRARGAVQGRRSRCRSCASRSSATPTRARSTPRSTDPPAVIERVAAAYDPPTPAPPRTASTASPSTSATGGSTSGRRTPSRCSGSTWRRPRRRECEAHTAEVLALIKES